MKLTTHPQWEDGFYSSLRKILIIMKLSIFFLLLGMLQVSASVFSQPVHVSFLQPEITMGDALATIEKSSEFKFFYRNDQVDVNRLVKVNKNYTMMDELLDNLLVNTDIRYKMVDNNLVILTKVVVQPIEIYGKVTDEKGNPLPYVSVAIKGSAQGVITSDEGIFKIIANKGDIIILSCIGYETVELIAEQIDTKKPVIIILKSTATDLDEVQIIGYGTTTKRFNTGNVVSIKAAAIASNISSRPLEALAGKVVGLVVDHSNGGTDLIVRGLNSISSGAKPLILVDGMVVDNLSFINQNDIESIDVLKDADATSIYGSRGTNGVILITSKKATLGLTKVTLNMYTGFSQLSSKPKLMNTQEYKQMRTDAFAMGNVDATGTIAINPIDMTADNAPDMFNWGDGNTDWVDYYSGNSAPIQNIDMSIQGGTKKLSVYASGQYLKQNGMNQYNPYLERLSGRLNVQSMLFNDRVTLDLQTSAGNQTNNYSPNTSTGLWTLAPNFTQYRADGSVMDDMPTEGYYNLENTVYSDKQKSKTVNLNLMQLGSVKVNIYKGLDVKAALSYSRQTSDSKSYWHYGYSEPYAAAQGADQTPHSTFNNSTYTSFNFEPQLTYEGKLWKGKISGLAGMTFLNRTTDTWSIGVTDPGTDELLDSWAASNPTTNWPGTPTSNQTQYKFNSVFGRAIYNLENTYILNLTYRKDGSSRFGDNYKFGDFYSVGGAWIFSNFAVVKKTLPFIYYGKLRASYGSTGTDNVGDYQYYSIIEPDYDISGYNGESALGFKTYPNENLHWEKTNKLDIGLELGFLKDRIHLSGCYYQTLSTDLLVQIPLTNQTGFTTYSGNFAGEVENKGWEFELRTINFSSDKPLQWSTNFNVYTNKNKLSKFDGLEDNDVYYQYEVGRALPYNTSIEMPAHFTGIDPATGLPTFADTNGDGVVDYNDVGTKTEWIGSSLPQYYGGLGNTFTYKGFSLDINIQFARQYMTTEYYMKVNDVPGVLSNQPKSLVGNYWKQPGDIAQYPRLYTGIDPYSNFDAYMAMQMLYPHSTAHIVKGNYYRLKNVELAYLLKTTWLQKVRIASARIYIRGENLATYTKEKLGKDPETTYGYSALIRQYVFGFQVSF